MRLALSRAQLALEKGEVPVGCVLVSAQGEVLCRTQNEVNSRNDLTAHAEMLAIRSVPRHALRGAKMYVTLEPCPMCAGAVALSGISRVIFGAHDKKYGCCGSVYRIPEDPAFYDFCACDGGLMEEECEALLKECFRLLREKP